MSHYYQQIFTVNQLHLKARLGCYAKERAKQQLVELSLRFYFPETPYCALKDRGLFVDYGVVSGAMHQLVEKKEFRLIEYMAMELFKQARKLVNKQASKDVKIWLKLTKLEPPVTGLQGGASYIYSDLPPDARMVAAE